MPQSSSKMDKNLIAGLVAIFLGIAVIITDNVLDNVLGFKLGEFILLPPVLLIGGIISIINGLKKNKS